MGNRDLSQAAAKAKAGLGSTLGATQGKSSILSPAKLTAKARRAGKDNKKEGKEEKDEKESGLASPTSISM